jgi:hypothetical protein
MQPRCGQHAARKLLGESQRGLRTVGVDTRDDHPRHLPCAIQKLRRLTPIELQVTVCVDPGHRG